MTIDTKDLNISIGLVGDMKQKKRIDPDTRLTPSDVKAILEAKKEHAEGKTIPWDKLKKELGLEDV